MAKLTPKQYAAKLRQKRKKLDLPLAIAAQTVHAMRVQRIFQTGSVARGYDKKQELWVADENLRRAGNHRGKTGKKIKTTYFKSYFDLHKRQGFTSDEVTFRLTNDLQSDFSNSQKTGGTGSPKVGKVIKVNKALYIEALRRIENVEKLNGLQKRFGKFTSFTPAERRKFKEINQLEFNKLLRG